MTTESETKYYAMADSIINFFLAYLIGYSFVTPVSKENTIKLVDEMIERIIAKGLKDTKTVEEIQRLAIESAKETMLGVRL